MDCGLETGSGFERTRGAETRLVFDGLKPDTAYSVRVAAVSCIGTGAFSGTVKMRTRPLPPAPPRLECANANHNSLKLRWGGGVDSKSSMEELSCQYVLEMENSRGQ